MLESNVINRAWTLPRPGSGQFVLNSEHEVLRKHALKSGQFDARAETPSLDLVFRNGKVFRVTFEPGVKAPHRFKLDSSAAPLAHIEIQAPDEDAAGRKDGGVVWDELPKDRAVVWKAAIALIQHLKKDYVSFDNHLHVIQHAAAADRTRK